MGYAFRVTLVLLVIGFIANAMVSLRLMCRPRPPLGRFTSRGIVTPSMAAQFDIRRGESRFGNRAWYFARYDRFGATILRAASDDVAPDHAMDQSIGLRGFASVPAASRPVQPPDGAAVPPWSLISEEPIRRRDQIEWRLLEGTCGWPMRSFLARYVNEPRRIGDSQLNIVRGSPADRLPFSSMGLSGRALPTSPIWTGLVVNTVFYAGIVALLWPGPVMFRTWRRRRTGRCQRCGYNLRGTDHKRCPECGRPAERVDGPPRIAG